MKNICREEKGLLSLEASIALTVFIFLMLFMYSFFVVFEARNAMGHAVLSTANSLSLDVYDTKLFKDGDASTQIVRDVFRGVYGSAGRENSVFVSRDDWYTVGADGELSGSFEDTVRTRFLAYLGGGDIEHASEVLEGYHIQNGAGGLDFSNSRTDGKNLYVSVQYTIEYEFQIPLFSLDALKMEQKACSKLWI